MSNPSFISFSGVSKSYDGAQYVVGDLNLDVRKGEFLSLLGPSGSGKTTTLMMLAGFESPTRGEIRLDGRRLDDKPPHQRDIGMVFQNYALFPHLTIAENVAFPLSVRRVSRAEQKTRVKRALEMIELPHLANRRPAQLSGGQQQRVALARALVFEPSVVLMDEPLGALDKRLRETMQYEIMRLHRELSLTIVYVTHDQAEALTMSDRVAVFSDGRIQQAATPSELYENAQNAFVANFVGENNGLTGRVVTAGEGWATLALSDGSIIRGRCERTQQPGARTCRGTGVLRRSSSRASCARVARFLRRESAQYAAPCAAFARQRDRDRMAPRRLQDSRDERAAQRARDPSIHTALTFHHHDRTCRSQLKCALSSKHKASHSQYSPSPP
jgi:putative spermidine/putrescine transport system ATP-binding protein